ncbi:hypothetical protein D3C77_485740 [compost metagenome]
MLDQLLWRRNGRNDRFLAGGLAWLGQHWPIRLIVPLGAYLDWTRLLTRAPPVTDSALNQFQQIQGDLAGQVDDPEPGQIGEHGEAEQEQCQKQQRAALYVQGADGQLTQAFAQRTAGRSRQAWRRFEMDIRQGRSGQHEKHQADRPPGKQPTAPMPGLMASPKDPPGFHRQQDRKQIGEVAQGHEQHTGQPSAEAAAGIADTVDLHTVIPGRIGRVVGEQRHGQVQTQDAKRDQRTFLEADRQLLAPLGSLNAARGGILQNT